MLGDLLILVPTLNEKDTIEAAVRRISAALPGAHILVLDDCSSDGTWQLAESLAAEIPTLHVMVRRDLTPGLGYSIIDGYRYARDKGFAQVCIVDCDLQQDPADVLVLMEKGGDSDLIIGSRYAQHWQLSDLMSTISNIGLRLMFLLRQRDVTTDFYVLKTHIFKHVDPERLLCKGYALFSEVKIRALKAGYRIAEIPVPGYEREQGTSKRSWRQVYYFGKEILRLWFELVLLRRQSRRQQVPV